MVARDSGVQIDNILTLDPVSRFSNGAGNKPSNVSSWTNIRTTGDSYGFNDLIADLGGQWGPVDDPNVNNYSSPASHGDIRGLLATDQGVAALTHNCER